MLGTIIFQDIKGKKARSNVKVTDKAALNTLCTSLDSFSNAKIIGYSVVDPADFSGTLDGTGTFTSVEAKLVLTFRYFDTDGNVCHSRLALPAPADVTVDHKEQTGWRAVLAQGEALAAILTTATGKTMTYTRGTVVSHPTEAQN